MKPFALLLLLVGYASAESGPDDSIMKEDVSPFLLPSKFGKVLKIKGFYIQTTMISVNTITTSSIWTCLSTARVTPSEEQRRQIRKRTRRQAMPVCQGRRRRSLAKKSSEMVDESSLMYGSSRNTAVVQPVSKEILRTGKRVAIWSTIYSTLDIYVTKEIPGATVTVSALCNIIGAEQIITNGCFIG